MAKEEGLHDDEAWENFKRFYERIVDGREHLTPKSRKAIGLLLDHVLTEGTEPPRGLAEYFQGKDALGRMLRADKLSLATRALLEELGMNTRHLEEEAEGRGEGCPISQRVCAQLIEAGVVDDWGKDQ